MSEKLTLVRLALRGERAELAEKFHDNATATANRAADEYRLKGDSPEFRALEAVTAVWRNAALIVVKRMEDDQP